MVQIDEKKLVLAALDDAKNFEKIIQLYEKKLDRFLLHLGVRQNEDREDLLQESFWKIYKNLNGFDLKLSLNAWIYRITRNTVYDYFRKSKSRGIKVEFSEEESVFFWENLLDESIDFTKEVDKKSRIKIVRDGLSNLPEKYREVLVLLFLEEKSYGEISDILQKNENTIATLISRGKSKFKKIFLENNKLKLLNQ